MRRNPLLTSLIAASSLIVLAGCTSSAPEPVPTTEEPVVEETELQIDELDDVVSEDAWVLQPSESEGSTVHTLGTVSYGLPAELEDISAEIAAPENVRVYVKELSEEQATAADAPVENIYVTQTPLQERVGYLSEEEQAELEDPLERLVFLVVREKVNAFPHAEDLQSGPVVNADNEKVGQYVTFMSFGERLTTVEILHNGEVYSFASTITGEVSPPEYIKQITLS